MGIVSERNILNIYLLGDCGEFGIYALNNQNYIFNDTNHFNWINDFSQKEITLDNLGCLMNDIIIKFQKQTECNCLLIFIKNQEFNDKVNLIHKYLANIKKVYRPIVILALNDENKKNEINPVDNKTIQDKENNSKITNITEVSKFFEIVYYNKMNYAYIENKIKIIYNYYFNIGDGFNNFIPIINDFTSKKEKQLNKGYNSKYSATFNILVIGRPGCGKSTLINLLLNEKRAREGIGYSITKLYTQYVHNKYPITFTDTPGFEDDEDLKKMEKFLSTFSIFFKEGKSKFHLVLYLINTSNERTFMGTELDLIDYINKNLNIPIFFVCTHSKTEKASLEFKEAVEINLIQRFGKNTNLKNHIYCCHLINEKNGTFKRFGIDKILSEIQNLFSGEIGILKKIEKNFENGLNHLETKNTEEISPLNMMSSLEKSNTFCNYLKYLSSNICEKYLTLNSHLPKKSNNDLDILEALKNHLAFEFNCESSIFDIESNNNSYFSKDQPKTGSGFICFSQSNGNDERSKDEPKKILANKIVNIKNFIFDYLDKNNQHFNLYMKNIIQSYMNAINSLIKIKDDINKILY